jgi:hypothetical protein
VAESIIQEVGGDGAARVLFKGKIVGVERTLRMGHVYSEIIIEGLNENVKLLEETKPYCDSMRIPFKDKNVAAYLIKEDGSETVNSLFDSQEYPTDIT